MKHRSDMFSVYYFLLYIVITTFYNLKVFCFYFERVHVFDLNFDGSSFTLELIYKV